jgi:hypothetical protein
VFRRLITMAVAIALFGVLVPSALAVQAKIRVEGKTTTIFGAVQPSLEAGTNALMALDAASLAGEFYYHVTVTGFGPFVDQIGRYPGEGFSGWSYKINGVSPPVGADQATIKTGDTVLWYWSTFTPQGGSPTLLLKRRAARNCYTVLSQNDLGQTEPAAGARLLVDGRRVSVRSGRGCVGRHHGLVRAVAANAVRSNALR